MVDLQAEFDKVRQAFFEETDLSDWQISADHPQGCAAPVLRHDGDKRITVAPWVQEDADEDSLAFSLIVSLAMGVHRFRLDEDCAQFFERAIFKARRMRRYELASRLLDARVAMARQVALLGATSTPPTGVN